MKKLRKVQREWRKKHEDISGSLSMRGLRYQYENYGEEEAMASLDKAHRYTQGYAYFDNVNLLVERIEQVQNKLMIYEDESGAKALERAISKIKQHIMTFKEEWIYPLYQELYKVEQMSMSGESFEQLVNELLF